MIHMFKTVEDRYSAGVSVCITIDPSRTRTSEGLDPWWPRMTWMHSDELQEAAGPRQKRILSNLWVDQHAKSGLSSTAWRYCASRAFPKWAVDGCDDVPRRRRWQLEWNFAGDSKCWFSISKLFHEPTQYLSTLRDITVICRIPSTQPHSTERLMSIEHDRRHVPSKRPR